MCSQWLAAVSLDDGCEPVSASIYHNDLCMQALLSIADKTVGKIWIWGIINTHICHISSAQIYALQPENN